MCGETGVEFQENPFNGSRGSDKKVDCSSGKVLIITDESQQNLCCLQQKRVKWKRVLLEMDLQQKPR